MTIDENVTQVVEKQPQPAVDVPLAASDATEIAVEAAMTPPVELAEEIAPMVPPDAPVAEVREISETPDMVPMEPDPVGESTLPIPETTDTVELVVEAAAPPEAPEPEAVMEPDMVMASDSGEIVPVPSPVHIAEVHEAPVERLIVAPIIESGPNAPTAPVTTVADTDLFDSYMNSFDGGGTETDAPDMGYKRLTRGERLEATIIQVDKDKVFVDLGTKAEGIIPLNELSESLLETAKGHFNVGDKVNVVVIRPEGAEGNPIVSKKRADFEEAWDRVEAAFNEGEMITAQVVDRVKGGLVVDIGVRGFVPATHVGSGKLRNIEKFVGQPLQLKVIEIDRERKKVVLSNREAEELRKANAKETIFQSVKPGETLDGTVRRLTDYGAFVDLGGVDGLLHISEMSWARINHPKEMFKEGQKIKVMVLRLDPTQGKISLGHRQVLPDPWNIIKDNYKIGQNLKIIIGRIVQSGAFIKLPEGAEAFMPVSEMSFRRIKRPQDVVEEGQEVEAQIIDLRTEERRMVLSMRALGGGGELRPGAQSQAPSGGGGFDDEFRRGDKNGKKKAGGKKGGRGGREDFAEDFEESVGRRGFATSGATIGERLGMLKGFLGRDEDDVDEEDTSAKDEDGATGEETAAMPAPAAAPEAMPSAPETEHSPTEPPAEE